MTSTSVPARAAVVVLLMASGCGSSSEPPPGISIALSADDSSACAGAARLRVEVNEHNGDSFVEERPAAVQPEQLDCDFSVGVAQALYAMPLGELEVGRVYTVSVTLYDSTDLAVAAGVTDPFEVSASKSQDPLTLQLTRVAPLGTVLIDLLAHDDFVDVVGDVDIAVMVGSSAVGARTLSWPPAAGSKRPLRISGLVGIGLRLIIELQDHSGTVLVTYLSDTFSVGSGASDAFARPGLEQSL